MQSSAMPTTSSSVPRNPVLEIRTRVASAPRAVNRHSTVVEGSPHSMRILEGRSIALTWTSAEAPYISHSQVTVAPGGRLHGEGW